MKKQLLIVVAAAASLNATAQLQRKASNPIKLVENKRISTATRESLTNPMYKTTGLSDTFNYINNYSAEVFDTSRAYVIDVVNPLDSGYYFGYNILGTNAVAEKYDFDYMADTTLQIIGVRSLWAGTVSPTSNKTIDIKIWSQGAQESFGPGFTHTFYEGFPDAVKKSQTLPITSLGIGNNNPDTIKNYYFATPLTGVNYNFYLGYEANYAWNSLNGDTITLRSTRDGKGIGTFFYAMNGPDSILLTRNTLRLSNGTWLDLSFDVGFDVNLSIVPIVQFSSNNINGIGKIIKNDLTYQGHYPNPAVNSTNIKFSLDKTADVTVQLTDINGRVINTITHPNLSAGEHTINVETSSLAAGNYVYVLRTSNGGAIAAQLTVIK